jgi:catechol-2,3-dioxygenase
MATIAGFSHVGLAAQDPAALAAFDRDALGMTITGGSDEGRRFGATAFLSSRPAEENHELAIFAAPLYRHLAFKAASLADPRALHRRVTARGTPVKLALNHGCSLAFDFDGPEGNTVEVSWPTGLDNPQPHGDPLDFDASDADLIAAVAGIAARAGLPLPPALAAMGATP